MPMYPLPALVHRQTLLSHHRIHHGSDTEALELKLYRRAGWVTQVSNWWSPNASRRLPLKRWREVVPMSRMPVANADQFWRALTLPRAEQVTYHALNLWVEDVMEVQHLGLTPLKTELSDKMWTLVLKITWRRIADLTIKASLLKVPFMTTLPLLPQIAMLEYMEKIFKTPGPPSLPSRQTRSARAAPAPKPILRPSVRPMEEHLRLLKYDRAIQIDPALPLAMQIDQIKVPDWIKTPAKK